MTWEECIRYEFKKYYEQAHDKLGGSFATRETDPVKRISAYIKQLYFSDEDITEWMIENSPRVLEGLKEAMDELNELVGKIYIKCEDKCTKGNHTDNSIDKLLR